MSPRAWIFAASLLAFPAAAMANDPPAHPCREDTEKFCADVKPGGGRIKECLKAHKDELSDVCKEAHARMK